MYKIDVAPIRNMYNPVVVDGGALQLVINILTRDAVTMPARAEILDHLLAKSHALNPLIEKPASFVYGTEARILSYDETPCERSALRYVEWRDDVGRIHMTAVEEKFVGDKVVADRRTQVPPPSENYRLWYEEAMIASNEAGYAGMPAAEVIRDMNELLKCHEDPPPGMRAL